MQIQDHPDYYTVLYYFPEVKDEYLRFKHQANRRREVPDLIYSNPDIELEFNISIMVNKFYDGASINEPCPTFTRAAVHPSGWPLMGVRQKGNLRMINIRRVVAMLRTNDRLRGLEVTNTCKIARCCSFEHIGMKPTTNPTN